MQGAVQNLATGESVHVHVWLISTMICLQFVTKQGVFHCFVAGNDVGKPASIKAQRTTGLPAAFVALSNGGLEREPALSTLWNFHIAMV